MSKSSAERYEVIRLFEGAQLSVEQTLRELDAKDTLALAFGARIGWGWVVLT